MISLNSSCLYEHLSLEEELLTWQKILGPSTWSLTILSMSLPLHGFFGRD